jgi:hypothetical protein
MIRIRFNGYNLSTFLIRNGTPGDLLKTLPERGFEVKREALKS